MVPEGLGLYGSNGFLVRYNHYVPSVVAKDFANTEDVHDDTQHWEDRDRTVIVVVMRMVDRIEDDGAAAVVVEEQLNSDDGEGTMLTAVVEVGKNLYLSVAVDRKVKVSASMVVDHWIRCDDLGLDGLVLLMVF